LLFKILITSGMYIFIYSSYIQIYELSEKLLFLKNITIEAYNYSLITDQTIARKREREHVSNIYNPIFLSIL